jgi:hypothetical protein
VKQIDYSIKDVPKIYVCSKCGCTGVKLWRNDVYLASDVELLCARCVSIDADKDITDIDDKGKYGSSDIIGGFMPAVPTGDKKSFWGYTNVPPPAANWWYRLPTLSTK